MSGWPSDSDGGDDDHEPDDEPSGASERDLERRIDRLGDESEDGGRQMTEADIWEARMSGTHPAEIETEADADALRGLYAMGTEYENKIDELDDEEKEWFDEEIARNLR